jgi:hypothetical protein
MSPAIVFAFLLSVSGVSATLLAATGDDAAMKLARQIVDASGGQSWNKVARIAFTFNVEADGKRLISAKHDWDLRGGTDTVTWGGKTVTVKLGDKNDQGDAKDAMQRWTNDSYWLLMPLKLLDGGVKLESGGSKEIDGQKYDVLKMSFESVGLTPGDHYNLYVDPQSHRVMSWDYMPKPDQTHHGTWEDYQTFGPLTLATKHQMDGKLITLTDISVKTD